MHVHVHVHVYVYVYVCVYICYMRGQQGRRLGLPSPVQQGRPGYVDGGAARQSAPAKRVITWPNGYLVFFSPAVFVTV